MKNTALRLITNRSDYDFTVARDYDKIAETYSKAYADQRSATENEFIRKLINKLIEEPVVDFGCGHGVLFDWYPDLDGYGQDVSAKMLEIARQRHPNKEFVLGSMLDFHELRFVNAFGTATCLFGGGVSYCEDLSKASNVIFDCLRPGGKFLAMFAGTTHPGCAVLHDFGLEDKAYKRTVNELIDVFKIRFRDVRIISAFNRRFKSLFLTRLESYYLTNFRPNSANYHIVIGNKPE